MDIQDDMAHFKKVTTDLGKDLTVDVAKVKTFWASYEVYLVGFVMLVIGIVFGHLVK